MKTLSPQTFSNARNFIFSLCSELIRQRWLDAFEDPNPAGVLRALSAYQNADGGFGHNLEGDFLLPDSSPMASSVAFQILTSLGVGPDEPLVQGGIAYLLKSFMPERPGWLSVSPAVNDYPHASWWHFKPELGGTVIDLSWGNPSAELVGYLRRYRDLVPAALLDPLLAHTLDYFQSFSGPMGMHELYCFLRFAQQLPVIEAQALQPKLAELVMQEVCVDPSAWNGYCAQPLDFVSSPQSFLYPQLEKVVQANLDFRIDVMTPDGVTPAPWNWEDYPAEWEAHRPEIAGRLALNTLILLKRFGRL
jgi:hypothetical protein